MKKFTKAFTSGASPTVDKKAQGTDASGCPSMEGLLQRKNAHNEWKKRHAKLQGTFFITNKPKHKKPTSEIKENIDLRDVASVGVYDDVLEIEKHNGEMFLYKYDEKDASGGSIDAWYDALNKRHIWAQTQPGGAQNRARSKSEAADPDDWIFEEDRIHVSGYLQKKSHNKYNGMQERFVKLQGKNLSYYKKKADDTALGTASMDTADFVRPYDASADCAIFEIQDEDRVFVFQTTSHAEMVRWVTIINKVLTAYKERKQALIVAKIAEETPYRVRLYDEIGEAEFLTKIEMQLAETYPTMEMEPDMSLKEHISCANDVLGYLMDFVPEVQSIGVDKLTRYDILAAVMTEVNTTLTERLSNLVLPTTLSSGAEQREAVYENATLGDLHQLIDWIARYQVTLKSVKCPVANSATAGGSSSGGGVVVSGAVLSVTCKNPKSSGVFGLMPGICKLYVHGGSAGAKGGAAHHLYDHCMKVWSSVVNNPEEMIQKHSNGSFYTHAPIDMWEAINQHVALATATNSPILHVLIAEKVVTSLSAVFNNIITYVQTLDTSDDAELQSIELEYISALANDTALHIEEVIELIDTFTISEIRERIDDIFDPLTTLLVQCGQACLKRLAMKVMSDVQSTLDEVFMPEWIEGSQVHVVTTTISDYMNDFETFLVEFWAAKFSYTILEAVILAYIRVILFKKGVQAPPTTPTTPDSPAPKVGFFSSLMRKTAEISQKVMNTGPQQCPVDEESLGRLAQDVNTLNAFFYKKAGQDVATEFLAIINEISLMLFLDGPALVLHAASRATEFPSAAAAIKIAAQATMRMRPETISRAHFDLLHSTLDPLIATAPQRLQQQEAQNIAEDRLSLLYTELIPPGMLVKPVASLAQRLKNMSHVNLGGVNVARQNSNDTGDDGSDCDSVSDGRASSSGRGSMGRSGSVGRAPSSDKRGGGGDLVDDIIGVLNTHDEEDAAYLQAMEEERQREEALRKRVGVLSYDGHMEKKSPAHNQWQRRWFKLVTRETMNPEMPYIYSFNWYKQEGAKVSNSLTVDQIKCLSVLSSCRALSYLPLTQTLSLQSEALNIPLAMVVKVHDPDATAQPNTPVGGDKEQWVTIRILQTDGKDHILRGAKVDRVIKWINLLSLAASLGYDEHEHTWTRNAFERNKEAVADYALQHPFIAPSSSNGSALFKPGSSHKLATGSGQSSQNSPRQGGELPPPGKGAGIDPEEAAAAIKAMKIEESKREAEERALAAQRREEARLAQEEEERQEALALEREEEAEREAERVEQARLEKAERDLQAARAAAFKRKADKDAAARAEKERIAREAAEAERLQQEAEEAERIEKEVMEQEARERRQRNLARQQGIVDDDESPAPASPGASPNPILQKDGKAKDVVNPLKRVSSIRRVPPPPPPPAGDASPAPAAAAPVAAPAPALAALSLQTSESNTSTTCSVDEPEAPASTPTSKPPPGKVIRMVGKRRASQQKVAHNTANAVSSENGSSMSGSSRADESDEEVDARRVSDEDSLTASPASSPMGRSLLKKNLAALQEQDSPLGRPSESPGGTGRKSLSRGVSFAADTRDVNRTSESDAPAAPAASPATLARTNSASRAPFSSAPAPAADEDSERDSDHARGSLGNNNNSTAAASTDDGEAEDNGAVATEQELSMLARKEGVVSGKLYRRSVVIMKKPTVQTPPEKEGYLMKKSPAMFAGWQKRYFLTNSNGDIEYYKSEADAHNGSVQPQGVIMTKYIKTDRGVEVNEKELDINIGSKTVHLRATDKAEARAWQSNITQWMLHSA